jgi:DNA-binding transcriptional LysR family regulator
MELRLIRYFLAVVDEGSITRAAGAVRVAQPSLSRQLRHLEQALGVALFERDGGKLRLSNAGRLFIPMARDLVGRADAAVIAMRDPARSPSLNLSVIAPKTTITDIIGPFLVALEAEALRVTIRSGAPFRVFRIVRQGDADLGVSAGPPPGELASHAIGRFKVWAQVAPTHRWADRDRISLTELVSEPLVVLSTDYGTRRLFDQVVAAAGLKYEARAEAGIPEVVQAFAAGGSGVAIATDNQRYGLQALAIDVDGADLEIPIVAAWDASHFAAATIAEWAARLAAFTDSSGNATRPQAERSAQLAAT